MIPAFVLTLLTDFTVDVTIIASLVFTAFLVVVLIKYLRKSVGSSSSDGISSDLSDLYYDMHK